MELSIGDLITITKILGPITAIFSFIGKILPKGKVKSRIEKLNGKLISGNLKQGKFKDSCELLLVAKSHKAEGSIKVRYSPCNGHKGKYCELEFHGSFEHDYLKLEYTNKDRSVKQGGIVLLELLADGRTLKGKFIGYGPVSKNMDECTGEVFLEVQ